MSEVKTKALAPIDEIRGTIAKMEPQFKMALPNHIAPDKFVRVMQTAVNNNPDLVKANRQSLLGAAMKAAQDGLLPDGKEAALVTFKDQVVYMPMTQGILKKVRNSGELASISPHVVYENDLFDYWIDEMGEHLKHKPKLTGSRGETTHAYCVARTKDGASYIEVMSREEIEQVRSVSRAKDGPAWKTWFGEMAKKTVTKRLAKRLPMSTDLESTLNADEELFAPPDVEPTPAPEKRTTSSRLKQAVGVEPERPVIETLEIIETNQESQPQKEELPI